VQAARSQPIWTPRRNKVGPRSHSLKYYASRPLILVIFFFDLGTSVMSFMKTGMMTFTPSLSQRNTNKSGADADKSQLVEHLLKAAEQLVAALIGCKAP
jgi:hypothetical protein